MEEVKMTEATEPQVPRKPVVKQVISLPAEVFSAVMKKLQERPYLEVADLMRAVESTMLIETK